MATDRQAEITASVDALQDLGPGYDQALAEGLVERIDAAHDSGSRPISTTASRRRWTAAS